MTAPDWGLQQIDLRWGQDDPAPYLVPVPRVPCIGEKFVGPDDLGEYTVTDVVYRYERGFYFPPSSVVVTVRKEQESGNDSRLWSGSA